MSSLQTSRSLSSVPSSAMLTLALSKGRIFDETLPLLAAAGVEVTEDPETSRKLILPTNDANVRVIIVRASDVPTYVQYGAADFGVAGKDVLLETRKFIVNRYVPDTFEKKLEFDGKTYGPGEFVQARIEVTRTAGGPMKDATANVVATVDGRDDRLLIVVRGRGTGCCGSAQVEVVVIVLQPHDHRTSLTGVARRKNAAS